MRSLTCIAFGLAFAACAPKPTAAPVQPSPVAQPVEATPEPEAAPAPKLGPFAEETPFLFQPHSSKARTRLLAKNKFEARVAPGGKTVLELGCGPGGRLVSAAKRKGVSLPVGHISDGVFSPDLGKVVLALGRGRMTVAAVPDGSRRTGVWDGADPAFIGPDLLMFRHRCQTQLLDLSAEHPHPRPVGKPHCGHVLHVNTQPPAMLVAEPAKERDGSYVTYRSIQAIDLESGEVTEVFSGAEQETFSSPTISPTGKALCFVQRRENERVLYCAEIGSAPEEIAKGVTGELVFDDRGTRLLYTVGPEPPEARDLFLLDFEARIVRKVASVAQTGWAFLPGGSRVVGYGGRRGTVYDLDAGWVLPVGDRHPSWEQVFVVPDDPNRLVVAEKSGNCRDLYWLELPRE